MLRRIKSGQPQRRPDAPAPSSAQPSHLSASSETAAAPRDIEVKNPEARLGEILVEEKIITPQQLDEGLAMRKKEGGFLGQALIELGYLDQDTLTLVLIKQCKIPHLNLLDYSIAPDVKGIIPLELCRKHSVLPVDKMGKILTVAMVDPLNASALEAVRAAYPELRIKPILCDWPHFQEVFNQFAPKAEAPAEAPAEQELPDALPEEEPVQNSQEPEVEPEKQSIPASATAESHSGSSFNAEELKAAIRDGMRESIAVLEKRVVEASQLLERAREAEVQMVTDQHRQDLGVPKASAPARSAVEPSTQEVKNESSALTFSFENFIVGDNNMAAVKIAQEIAKEPGADRNPLFVCGDVGLGKTHLITAVSHALKASHPDLKVGITSAGRFVDDAMSAQETHARESFRRAFDQWDAIILDDVQFLGGRVEAQEDLFHIFNALQEKGKQIIIAGDRAPEKLGLLEKRLVSRFDSGVVAHIHAPEWDTRVKILRHYAKQMKLDAPDDVVAMIAMRHTDDIRRLIGALRKVAARAKSNGGAISAEVASQVLAEGMAEVAA